VTSRTVRAILVALVVVQIAWYWPRLPATVASHFDGSGRPNGWLSKEMFLAVYVGIVALLAVVFSAVRFIPTSLWNLPNRDYWLAPERRAATVARFSEEMLWFANATLALVLLTFELAFRANLPGGRSRRARCGCCWRRTSSLPGLVVEVPPRLVQTGA
jgi:serine/threonine-protein kinase